MATKKIKQVKSQKVYEVETGATVDGEDVLNWSAYNVVAIDILSAIEEAKKFFSETEYPLSVKMICGLD